MGSRLERRSLRGARRQPTRRACEADPERCSRERRWSGARYGLSNGIEPRASRKLRARGPARKARSGPPGSRPCQGLQAVRRFGGPGLPRVCVTRHWGGRRSQLRDNRSRPAQGPKRYQGCRLRGSRSWGGGCHEQPCWAAYQRVTGCATVPSRARAGPRSAFRSRFRL